MPPAGPTPLTATFGPVHAAGGLESGEPLSPTELLSRAERGDQAAWQEIVTRFTSLLWSVPRAHRLSDDEALDVVQTTWMRLVENLGRIHDPERLAGWLATTARRESLRVIRQSG